MPQSSWLFVKDGQSIWVERVSTSSILVAGPAEAREERSFPDEDSLQAFQIGLGERLTNGGWFLWGFDRERRETTERRGATRPGGDRRRAAGRGKPRPGNLDQTTLSNPFSTTAAIS